MAEFTGSIQVDMPELFAIAGAQTDVESAQKALSQAQVVIESISGVVFDVAYREIPVSNTDAFWVRRATIFQAAWLVEQSDALSRVGVRSLNQDGLSATAQDGLTFVLAPMAKRSLQNCSWAKSNTIPVDVTTYPGMSILISDDHPWSPIGSA